MITIPTLTGGQLENTPKTNSTSVSQRFAQKTANVLGDQEQEKTPLSEGYIEPSSALMPILGEIQDETGAIPYSFETTKMNSPEMGTPTWFRIHGLNKAGKGFILSGSISGDSVNIQHILAEGLGQHALQVLEKHLVSIGIKTCYATFTKPRTSNAFINHYGYSQIPPEDVPTESHEKLGLVETDISRIRHSPDDFRKYSEILRKRDKPYGTYPPEETELNIHFEDKQILTRKDISQ